MSVSETRFTVTVTDGVMIAAFQGPGLLDEERLGMLSDMCEIILDKEEPRIVIDLSGIKFCSSSVIGKFVALYKSVVGLGGALKFAVVQGPLMQVFRITKLDRLFEVHDTLENALKSFDG